MTVRVQSEDFNVATEIATLTAGRTDIGALVTFTGLVRGSAGGRDLVSMTLEHYPGMTESYLNKICEEAKSRWDIIDCLIVHRVGDINPNDPIVLTAVWSAHRAAAFDACRYLMEELKSRAPFWKKETLKEGERWVEKNTPG